MANDHAMQPILALLAEGKTLPHDMAVRGFQMIMNGGATTAQAAAFMMALRLRGETVEEIAAGALALRAKAAKVKSPEGTIDTCGTGGDARGTYNISTAVAFVLAACGVPVAKHGNRSVSSLSGSADVQEVLGVKIDVPPQVAQRCLEKIGMCFLYAPSYHTAMRHVAPIRQELGMRTVFNLLGPLSNPAAPDYQVMGVYRRDLVEPLAHVLKQLGTKAAWVVHGTDGLDELSLTGSSYVAQLKDGQVSCFEVTPQEAGLETCHSDEIKGRDPEHNANALRDVLAGRESAYRRAVVLNAAAGLVVAGKAAHLKEGAGQAEAALDDGHAYAVLRRLAEESNNP